MNKVIITQQEKEVLSNIERKINKSSIDAEEAIRPVNWLWFAESVSNHDRHLYCYKDIYLKYLTKLGGLFYGS